MAKKTQLIILFLLSLILLSESASFNDYRVFRITPQTQSELKFLRQVEESTENYMFLDGVNTVGELIDVVTTLHTHARFETLLKNENILYQKISDNFEETCRFNEPVHRYNGKRSNAAFSFDNYFTLAYINQWLDKLMTTYAEIVTSTGIGKTYGKREIRVIKLSSSNATEISKKPAIFLEGGTSGRSWLSISTVLFILNKLLTSKEEQVKHLLISYDWYFMPILNPDGYEYSDTERLWNKNLTPQLRGCSGVDLNRNWKYGWKKSTANACIKTCLANYPGNAGFSELETQSAANFILKLLEDGVNLKMYLSFQQGRNKILYPYGSNNKKIPNLKLIEKIADTSVKALAKIYGTKYSYGTLYEEKYPIYGTSTDWAYSIGIPLSFRYELPGPGYQFLQNLPRIKPNGEEVFDSISAMINESKNLGFF